MPYPEYLPHYKKLSQNSDQVLESLKEKTLNARLEEGLCVVRFQSFFKTKLISKGSPFQTAFLHLY